MTTDPSGRLGEDTTPQGRWVGGRPGDAAPMPAAPTATPAARRPSLERVTFDGDITRLDEVVLSGVDLHIERLDTHEWMIRVTRPERISYGPTIRPALVLHLHGNDLTVHDEEGTDHITTMGPPPILCKEWTDRHGIRHECHIVKPHKRHRCTCGKWRQVDDR